MPEVIIIDNCYNLNNYIYNTTKSPSMLLLLKFADRNDAFTLK